MSNQMFPNAPINNPFAATQIGPEAAAQQYKMAYRQRLADMLTQQGMQQPQSQMVSGHYIAPSPLQYLSGLVNTGLGAKYASGMPEQQADYNKALAEQLRKTSMQMTGQAQMTDPQANSAALANGGGPTNANAQMAGQYQSGQAAPLAGIDPSVVAGILQNGGPTQLAEFIRQVNSPTDKLKEYRAAGFSQSELGNAIRGKAASDSSISAGNIYTGLDGVQRIAPKVETGMNFAVDPRTGMVSSAPIDKYATNNALIKGAETGAIEDAKAARDLVQVQDPINGNMVWKKRSDIVNPEPVAPPANTGAQPLPASGQQPAGDSWNIAKVNPDTIAAKDALGGIEATYQQATKNLTDTMNHPGLEWGTGAKSLIPTVPGTAQADFVARHDQIKGQAFLQAYQKLRGGGAITDIEGQKATDAVARLNRAQTSNEYKKALTELQGILDTARSDAYKKAGVPMSGSQQKTESASTPKDSSGIYRPKTKAEYDALPSGSRTYNSKGQLVTKP